MPAPLPQSRRTAAPPPDMRRDDAARGKAEHIRGQAARLFARHGFEGVAMRDVAEASGVTMTQLYYYFSSKAELHDEISEWKYDEFIATIQQQWRALAADARKPSAMMGLIFDAVVCEPTFFLLMQQELNCAEPGRRHARSRRRYTDIFELLRSAAWHRTDSGDHDIEVFVVCSLITGFCELVQADQRFAGPDRAALLQCHRAALVDVVRRQFDRS